MAVDETKTATNAADHVEGEHGVYRSQVELIDAAVAASAEEALIPRKELFLRYWPGVVFSMLLSMALIMVRQPGAQFCTI